MFRAGCRRCECNSIGATGDGCDADTGFYLDIFI